MVAASVLTFLLAGAAPEAVAAPAAAPAGLIAYCDRAPANCRVAGQGESDVLAEVAAARRLFWSAAFAGREVAPPGARRTSSLRRPHGKTEIDARRLGLSPRPISRRSIDWRTVETINAAVNAAIRDRSDLAQYGVADFWAVAPALARGSTQGDCEDYALTKRARLLESGIPASSLSLALADTAWGEPHAVLLVATEDGDYILDNLTPGIVHVDQSDLVWRSRQAPGEMLSWVKAISNG